MNESFIPDYQRMLRKRTGKKQKKLYYAELDEDYNVIYAANSIDDAINVSAAQLCLERPSVLNFISLEDYQKIRAFFDGSKQQGTVRFFFEINVKCGDFDDLVFCLIYKSHSAIIDSVVFDVFFVNPKSPDFTEQLILACEMETDILYKRALDGLAVPVAITSQMDIEYANPAFAELLGYKLSVLHSMSIANLVIHDDRDRVQLLQQSVYNGEKASSDIFTMPTQSGGEVKADIFITKLSHSESANAINIFVNRTQSIASSGSGEFYKTVFESVNSALMVVDSIAKRVSYNEAFARELGMGTESGVIGLDEMLESQHYTFQNFYDEFRPRFESCDFFDDYHNFYRKDGTIFPSFATSKIIGERIYLTELQNVSEQLELERSLEMAKTHDYLTGLCNADTFFANLKTAFEEAEEQDKNLGFLAFDLDSYNNILSEIGPSAASALLKTIALRIKSFVGSDELLGKIGQKRFGIIIKEKTREELLNFVEDFMNTLDWPVVHKGHDIFVTVSAGLCLYPEDVLSYREFYNYAFDAMEFAHSSTLSSYATFTREDGIKLYTHKSSLETDLSISMESDEFVVFFQPKADIKSGQILEGEALIRWESPVYGIVPPSSFLHLAEATGMIVPLGYKVIELVCRSISGWAEQGLKPIKISINLALEQIFDENFVSEYEALLSKYSVPHELIEFEISESTARFGAQNELYKKIIELKNKGIVVAIDNFGLGKISVSELSDMPIERLTIDRSITNGCENDHRRREKIEQTIKLAKRFEVKTIAEGVENEEQLQILGQLGCDYYQGYYLSRPVAADDFAQFLTESAGSGEKA